MCLSHDVGSPVDVGEAVGVVGSDGDLHHDSRPVVGQRGQLLAFGARDENGHDLVTCIMYATAIGTR